jgi:hypothetical protein
MLTTAQSLSYNIGVYTSASQWQPIMGDWTGASGYILCMLTFILVLPLWWPKYDGHASFSNFSPFGGWSQPAIKQYQGDASECGVGVDKSWYP